MIRLECYIQTLRGLYVVVFRFKNAVKSDLHLSFQRPLAIYTRRLVNCSLIMRATLFALGAGTLYPPRAQVGEPFKGMSEASLDLISCTTSSAGSGEPVSPSCACGLTYGDLSSVCVLLLSLIQLEHIGFSHLGTRGASWTPDVHPWESCLYRRLFASICQK